MGLAAFQSRGYSRSATFLGKRPMSKAFLASVLQDSLDCTGVGANRAAAAVIDAIVHELKTTGGFTLSSFGTFTVRKTKASRSR
jgi:DNA-binding protein HU-beta